MTLQRGTIFTGCFPQDRLRSLMVAYARLTRAVVFSARTCNLLEMPRGGGERAGEWRGGGGGLASEINNVVMARNLKRSCSKFACLVCKRDKNSFVSNFMTFLRWEYPRDRVINRSYGNEMKRTDNYVRTSGFLLAVLKSITY